MKPSIWNENVENGTKRKYARDKSEDSLQIEQGENNSNLKESVSEGQRVMLWQLLTKHRGAKCTICQLHME